MPVPLSTSPPNEPTGRTNNNNQTSNTSSSTSQHPNSTASNTSNNSRTTQPFLTKEEADRLYEERMEEEYAKREGAKPLIAKPGTSEHADGCTACEIDPEAQDCVSYRTFQRTPSSGSETLNVASSQRARINPKIVSDAILGLSDGLTVPFALSAGLSALGNTKVVVMGSLAELMAGAISMGLGGYVGAKSEVESYEATVRETKQLVHASETETTSIVREVFARYNLPEDSVTQMSEVLHNSPQQLLDFLVTFHHNQSPPGCNQAFVSAITLGLGYFIGGFIPLIPYFIAKEVMIALYYSIGVMAITLLAFGYVKTCIVRGWSGRDNIMAGIKGGFQMVLVGGVAAGAAIALVRAINGPGHKIDEP
ncbi:hypothetical protein FQN57_005165 [Myotisia sp. PD_48]|nr:hypothetical protein FQN57_005165 [Myotisia sp. PD_48]